MKVLIMKKSGLFLLTSQLMIASILFPTQNSVASPGHLTTVQMDVNHSLSPNKKNRKGYKKKKSGKILGIFKRKSDCGCPKHK